MSVVIAGAVVVVGAGLAAAQSKMQSDAENSKLAQQQAGLQIKQSMDIASTITRNLNATEEMGAETRRGRMKLTKAKRAEVRGIGAQVTKNAESGAVGATHLAMYQAMETQYGMTEGNIIHETASNVRKTAKQAEEGLRITQGRMNDDQGRINMAQASKTSATDSYINAGIDGFKGAQSTASSVSAFV